MAKAEIENSEDEGLVNTEGARQFLGGVSERTMDNLVSRGVLKPRKIFRRRMFRKRDLIALARTGTK